jgi:hypothetical protein
MFNFRLLQLLPKNSLLLVNPVILGFNFQLARKLVENKYMVSIFIDVIVFSGFHKRQVQFFDDVFF